MSFDTRDDDSDLERRTGEEIESLLRYTADDPHLEPLDDLTRRRLIDQVLDEVETAPLPERGRLLRMP
jgi:hypothetical protein